VSGRPESESFHRRRAGDVYYLCHGPSHPIHTTQTQTKLGCCRIDVFGIRSPVELSFVLNRCCLTILLLLQ